ncbi:FHA domain-containing protein [Haliangium ochraceum]|uniref:FHA domain containing protein n=1 Tax=Haliangium ochraceum (strain DSM 14365 / JCM 11303 / SMP-2) TaxID=502025 RepID=D0LZN2_HALO1|nr:FHA domain-containing protein [Haliangium ochraceum]ACY18011.1 FHA domain containing protein [Haliangium ochraceum DSM 14365]
MNHARHPHRVAAAEESRPGGLRVLRERRVFPLIDPATPGWHPEPILIGRDSTCQLQLLDVTVSAIHCTLVAAEGRYLLRDADSRNGLEVSHLSALDGFVQVSQVVLKPGLHLRLGTVQLAVLDQEGQCPLKARNLPDFFAQAQLVYGSRDEAARRLGLSADDLRELLPGRRR